MAMQSIFEALADNNNIKIYCVYHGPNGHPVTRAANGKTLVLCRVSPGWVWPQLQWVDRTLVPPGVMTSHAATLPVLLPPVPRP